MNPEVTSSRARDLWVSAFHECLRLHKSVSVAIHAADEVVDAFIAKFKEIK